MKIPPKKKEKVKISLLEITKKKVGNWRKKNEKKFIKLKEKLSLRKNHKR